MAWISVKDRYPEIDDIVIVRVDFGPNRQGHPTPPRMAWGARCDCCGDGNWLWGIFTSGMLPPGDAEWSDIKVDDDYNVTHWMPRPELPVT